MSLFLLSFIVIVLGVIFLIYLIRKNRSFGILTSKRIYEDTQERPGQTLYAKTIPLIGKPDYLIEENNNIIPVEVKTGKTPISPYLNHTMQLMAYCYLVEENFATRPPGGYIRYPQKEFKVAYTDEARESVKNIVMEILEKKEKGQEISCPHPRHN